MGGGLGVWWYRGCEGQGVWKFRGVCWVRDVVGSGGVEIQGMWIY